MEAGTPVFLVTEGTSDGFVYSVRMIAAKTPEVYGTQGMEELRIERRRTGSVKRESSNAEQ